MAEEPQTMGLDGGGKKIMSYGFRVKFVKDVNTFTEFGAYATRNPAPETVLNACGKD